MKPRGGLAVNGTTAVISLSPSQVAFARPRNIFTDTLVWNGITVLMSFEHDWLGLAAGGFEEPYSHLELQVLDPKGAPLPVTDTGYWSEFLPIGEVDDIPDAKAIAMSILDEMSDTQTWRVRWTRWEQRDLFV